MAAIAIRTLNRAMMVGGLLGTSALAYASGTMNPVSRSVRPTVARSAPVRPVVVAPSAESHDWIPAEPVASEPVPATIPADWQAVSVDTPNGNPSADDVRAELVATARGLGIKGISAKWKLETIREKIASVRLTSQNCAA